jgi:hypothetical protein
MKTLFTIWLCWITLSHSSAVCTRIPFELIQKLIVVRATVNGIAGNFIVDTGVSGLILNNQYFKGRDSNKQFCSVLGEISPMEVNYVDLELGAFVKKNIYAEIIPLNISITERPVVIMGLIGCNVFRNSELLIDYEHEQLVICEPEKGNGEITSNFNDYHGKDEIPVMLDLYFTGQLPYIRFNSGIFSLKLILDTGAGIAVIDERYEGQWQISLMEEIVVGGLGLKPYRSQKFYLDGLLTDQGYDLKMQSIFYDMTSVNQRIAGPDIDGIVGFELLNAFTTLIDFRKRKIYLWPRTRTLLATLKPAEASMPRSNEQ